MPDVKYKTLKEAESILKESNLKVQYDVEINKEDKEKIIVKEQIPSAGITINSGSTVKLKIE